MRRPVAFLLVLQVLVALWFVTDTTPGTDAALRGLPVDDAWIHLVYGRAVLTTGLPAYNPGQLETGFTSPLQVVVAAVAVALSGVGVPVAIALKLLTLACTLPATALAARLTEGRVGPAAGTLAAALLAFSPTVAFASLSGMEVGAAGTLMLAAWAAADAGRPRLVGALLLAAVLARPEAILLVPLFAPVARWHLWPVAAGVAAWAGYDLAVTGHALPTTYYAKAEPTDLRRLLGAAQVLAQAWPTVGTGIGVLAWAVAVGVAAAKRQWRDAGAFLVPVVFVAAVAVGRLISQSDQFFYFLRYFLPVEPLFVVAVAVGVGRLAALRHGRVTWLAAVVVLGLQLWGLPARRDLYAWNCQNIEEMQGAVADWLSRNAPGATVASVDAGLLRYRGGVEVVDVIGLNDHALLFEKGLRSRILKDPGAMAAWMRDHDIAFLYTFPALLPFTAPERHPEEHFDIVLRVTSAHYTVAGAAQGTALVLRPKAGG